SRSTPGRADQQGARHSFGRPPRLFGESRQVFVNDDLGPTPERATSSKGNPSRECPLGFEPLQLPIGIGNPLLRFQVFVSEEAQFRLLCCNKKAPLWRGVGFNATKFPSGSKSVTLQILGDHCRRLTLAAPQEGAARWA